jgi:hypothetical protein
MVSAQNGHFFVASFTTGSSSSSSQTGAWQFGHRVAPVEYRERHLWHCGLSSEKNAKIHPSGPNKQPSAKPTAAFSRVLPIAAPMNPLIRIPTSKKSIPGWLNLNFC